jgi:hypothetical protein
MRFDAITPLVLAAVLEPEDRRRHIRRNMLETRGPNDLALIVEDLLGLKGVPNSAIKQTALNPIVRFVFPTFSGPTKIFVLHTPPFDSANANFEEIG